MSRFNIYYDRDILKFIGIIDEYSDMSSAIELIKREKIRHLDLENVIYINSFGVRSWINLVSSLEQTMILHRCSPIMVEQFAAIEETMKNCAVKSIIIENYCTHCDCEAIEFLEFNQLTREKFDYQSPVCPKCGENMEPEDDLLDYLEEQFEVKEMEKSHFGRCEERKPLNITVKIKDSDGRSEEYYTRDISRTGIFIYSENPMPTGQEVDLEFKLPYFDGVHIIRGLIIWHNTENQLTGFGVEFVESSESLRASIEEYIRLFYQYHSPIKNKKSLLVVDDDVAITDMLKLLLTNRGYKIFIAANGLEAYKLLTQINVGMIITNQQMPKMGGLDFLRKTKLLYPHLPVIVISAMDLDDLGFLKTFDRWRYIKKPFDYNEIIVAVNKMIG